MEVMTDVVSKPKVFEYIDYRLFLKDMRVYLKAVKRISNNQLSKIAKFKSNSYYRMIESGERNLSMTSAEALAQAFELNVTEKKFFFKIIDFNQEPDLELKEEIFQQLSRFKQFQKARVIDSDSFEVFSHWYIIALYEYFDASWRSLEAKATAEQLGLSISELKSGLKLLIRLGLLEEKAQDKYRRTSVSLHTPSDNQNFFLRQYYREMLLKAAEHLKIEDGSDRGVFSVSLPMNQKSFEKVRKQLWKMALEIDEEHSDRSSADAIYHVNLNVFPLLDLKPKQKK